MATESEVADTEGSTATTMGRPLAIGIADLGVKAKRLLTQGQTQPCQSIHYLSLAQLCFNCCDRREGLTFNFPWSQRRRKYNFFLFRSKPTIRKDVRWVILFCQIHKIAVPILENSIIIEFHYVRYLLIIGSHSCF